MFMWHLPLIFQVPTILFKAPELLLGSNGYAKPVDIWAIGCIFAEMVEGKSLFGSGDKSDIDISILHEIFRYVFSQPRNHLVNLHLFVQF